MRCLSLTRFASVCLTLYATWPDLGYIVYPSTSMVSPEDSDPSYAFSRFISRLESRTRWRQSRNSAKKSRICWLIWLEAVQVLPTPIEHSPNRAAIGFAVLSTDKSALSEPGRPVCQSTGGEWGETLARPDPLGTLGGGWRGAEEFSRTPQE